jgi:hypothetical protein
MCENDSGFGSEGAEYRFPSENILETLAEISEVHRETIVNSTACISPGCNKMLIQDSQGIGSQGVPLTNNYGQEAMVSEGVGV